MRRDRLQSGRRGRIKPGSRTLGRWPGIACVEGGTGRMGSQSRHLRKDKWFMDVVEVGIAVVLAGTATMRGRGA
jgi:hypothetical protein